MKKQSQKVDRIVDARLYKLDEEGNWIKIADEEACLGVRIERVQNVKGILYGVPLKRGI